MTDRVLPHAPDAERAVLADVLNDNSRLPEVRAVLVPSKFYDERHGLIFMALCALADVGSALDIVTVKNWLATQGKLGAAGGPAYLAGILDGALPSRNVRDRAWTVAEKAYRRSILMGLDGLRQAAWNGASDREVRDLLAALASERIRGRDDWTPSTLRGVVEKSAGEVPYLVEGLVPVGEVTILGAGWKTGKTLVAYRLVLDLVRGSPVFGRYRVPEPVRVALFQLEIPPLEDERRFRRLAIGCGMSPEDVPGYVDTGALVVYNRPALSLSSPLDVQRFHDAVRAADSRLVVLDSFLAAFAGVDLNDNAAVRRHFSAAFLPLTSEGRAVLGIHHRRKRVSGARSDENDRHALLGAQAFGAAAGRIYTLDRLRGHDTTAQPGQARSDRAFMCRLSLTGSWTPEDGPDVVLEVRDTEDGGTTVLALSQSEELAAGGVSAKQRAALALARLVRLRRRIGRRDAFRAVQEDESVSERTCKAALAYAKEVGWISTTPAEARKRGELDLVPGPQEENL